MQQTLYDFKVHCTHKRQGCEWTGELRELDDHLNPDPPAKQTLDGCQFTVIGCPLSYAGCDIRLPRQDIPIHLSESSVSHMLLQAEQQTALLEMSTVLESENADLRKELKGKTEQIDDLEFENSELKDRLSILEARVDVLSEKQKIASTTGLPIGPVDFTMHNFDKQKKDGSSWWSAPFYTHPQGYKMVLRVDANGWGEGKGTHVSMAVYLKNGEFDQLLKWPFRARITIQLLNQECKESEENRIRVISILTQSKEKAMKGIGEAKFIHHSDLRTKDYLKNDCLQFRIIHVVLL